MVIIFVQIETWFLNTYSGSDSKLNTKSMTHRYNKAPAFLGLIFL